MKTKLARTSAIAFSGLLLLSALAIFVPTAAAQNSKLDVNSKITTRDGEPILPDTGVVTLKIQTTVKASAGSGCVIPIKVTWLRGAIPSYATMIFNPSSQSNTLKNTQGVPVTEAAGNDLVYSTDVIITVNREAPAFQDGAYEIKVKVEAGQAQSGTCNFENPQDSTVPTTVKNGYFPLTQINPQSLFIKSGQNKKVIFPVDIVNMGNGPTRVKIDLAAAGKNRLDSMNAGGEVRLDTRAGKGATAQNKLQRNIEAQTPHSNGYTNSIYSFTAKFTSSYDGAASGTLLTDETSITLSVQVQGVYVPGPDPMAIIVAIGIALVGLSRLRKD